MTTAVNDRLADYTGDGSTVTFAFDFPISAASELELVEVTSAGVSSTLVYLTDYTVSIGSGGTGTITRTTAPASGSKLYIAGNTPSEQSAAYSDVDEFPATAHEGSMDAIVRVQQEIKRNLGRMPRYPFGETTAAAWPAAALRAGYVARFNATTGALEPSDLNDSELQDLTALTDAEKANIATVAEAIDDGTLDDLLNGSMLEVDTVAALKAVATTSLTTGRAVMTKGYYSIGDGGAGHARKYDAGAYIDVPQTAPHPAHQGLGKIKDSHGNAAVIHQVTGEYKKRNRQQRKAVDAVDHAVHDHHIGHSAGQQHIQQA